MIVKDRPALPLDVGVDAREEVELLSRSSTYGERTGCVERLETHISWLFLTKRRVYKLKKPVRFDFLDYGTAQRRKQACEAEVQLNGRLAPHTYLGVMPLVRNPRGRLQLGGQGTPVDWVVVMRRLDAGQSLDALIRSGRVTRQQVDQLATRLSDFYRQLPPLTIRAQEYRQRIEEHAQANRQTLLEAAGELDVGAVNQVHSGRAAGVSPSGVLDAGAVHRVHAGQLRVLTLAPDWLEDRVCDGRVVEGHGDLRPDHIYFQPGPIIIDCIEFNAEFRQLDVLDELSYLAMECDIRQAGWIGRHILERYGQTNGDHPPKGLLSFYKCYRATVHAKVAALRAEQHPADPQAGDWSLARQYLQRADAYAASLGPPLLVVMRGLAGCGKSSVATALSDRLGLACLQTDAIRRELFPVPQREAAGVAVYRDDNRGKVYQELLRRAERLMDQRFSLVLDGTFGSRRWLTAAMAAGTSRHFATLVVDCRCPDDVALKRIADRWRTGAAISEATSDVYRRQQREFEPLPAGLPVCPLSTAHSLPELLAVVYRHLRGMLTA